MLLHVNRGCCSYGASASLNLPDRIHARGRESERITKRPKKTVYRSKYMNKYINKLRK